MENDEVLILYRKSRRSARRMGVLNLLIVAFNFYTLWTLAIDPARDPYRVLTVTTFILIALMSWQGLRFLEFANLLSLFIKNRQGEHNAPTEND